MDSGQGHLIHLPQLRLGAHLFAEAESVSRLMVFALLEQHARLDKRFSSTVLVRYSVEPDPLGVLERFGSRHCSAQVRRSVAEPGAGVLALSSPDGLAATIAVLPSLFANVWLLVSDVSRSSVESRVLVEPMLRMASRRVAAAWMTTTEIQAIVLGSSARARLEVTPTRISSVQRDGSNIRFPRNTSGKEVFAGLDANEAVLRSLDFILGSQARPALRVSIERTTRATFKGGSAHAFEQYIVAPLEAHTQKHFRSLGISRDDVAGGKEIAFRFRRGVMADKTANRRLIDTLGHLERASVNAYHSNPYLHVAITDLWDGSTMDLFAHTPDELVVVPGIACSSKAVSRVFDHVYDHFAAGEVADIPEVVTSA